MSGTSMSAADTTDQVQCCHFGQNEIYFSAETGLHFLRVFNGWDSYYQQEVKVCPACGAEIEMPEFIPDNITQTNDEIIYHVNVQSWVVKQLEKLNREVSIEGQVHKVEPLALDYFSPDDLRNFRLREKEEKVPLLDDDKNVFIFTSTKTVIRDDEPKILKVVQLKGWSNIKLLVGKNAIIDGQPYKILQAAFGSDSFAQLRVESL